LPDAKVYNDFVIGPGKIELALNPGESRTVNVTIANRLGAEKIFNVTEEDIIGSRDLAKAVVLLGDDRGPYSLKDILNIPSALIKIPHGQKVFLPVTISVPANAQPGGMYGSVVVSVASSPQTGATNEGASIASNPVITRLAALFFVRVAGPVAEQGKLTQFSLGGNRSILFENDPVNFDLVFENTGNIHLVPNGMITITNLAGAPVGTVAVDPWFAMPQSLRFREVTWAPPFLFGRYVAHAVINRGYGSTTDVMDVVFWVIPWKIIAVILIGLILLISSIRWIASRFHISRRQ